MKSVLKSFIITVLLISISLGISFQISAATNKNSMKLQIANIGPDFIEIDWSNVKGDYFVLKNNQNTLYEGNKTSYFEGNLEEGTLLQYHLTTFNKQNKLLEIYELTTYTDFNNNDVINYSVLSNDSVILLNWTDVKDAIKYNVYLNDKLLAETTQSEYSTSNLPSGESFDYKIVVYLPNTDEIPEDLQNEPLSQSYQYDLMTLNIKASTTVVPDITKKEFIKKYNSQSTFSNSISSNNLTTTAAGTTATTIKIRTFIAEACYSASIPGSGEGDGRGPSATAGTHRTLVNVTAYFNPSAYTKNNHNGQSVSYKKNGCNPIDESGRQTATEAPNVTHYPETGYADIRVKHSIGAPFYNGVLPNIDYDFTIKIYSSGATVLSGRHDGFPDYEIYKSSTASPTWTRLYYWDASANGQSIGDLIPPMDIDV